MVFLVLILIREATLVYKGLLTLLQAVVRQNFPVEQLNDGPCRYIRTVAAF